MERASTHSSGSCSKCLLHLTEGRPTIPPLVSTTPIALSWRAASFMKLWTRHQHYHPIYLRLMGSGSLSSQPSRMVFSGHLHFSLPYSRHLVPAKYRIGLSNYMNCRLINSVSQRLV